MWFHFFFFNKKSNKIDGWNHHKEDKKEGKKKSKDMQPTKTKEGRKLIPFMLGIYLTHNPFNMSHAYKS